MSELVEADAMPSNFAHRLRLSERDVDWWWVWFGSTSVLVAGSAMSFAASEPMAARTVVGLVQCGSTWPRRRGPSAVKVKSCGRNHVPGIFVKLRNGGELN